MSTQDINILPHKYYVREIGTKRWVPLGFTENGQTTFSRTIEKTVIGAEQMKSIEVLITDITGTFSLSAMESSKDNLLLAFPDSMQSIDQYGNTFLKFGQDGGATPKYYEFMAVSAKKLKSGNYNALYLAKVSPGGTVDIAFSQDTNVVIPMEFELLSDENQPENQKVGVWFEALTDDVDLIPLPTDTLLTTLTPFFSESNNASIAISGAAPTLGVSYTGIIPASMKPIFSMQNSAMASVTLTEKTGFELKGKASTGSTTQSFVHGGPAFKADALIGTYVKFVLISTGERRTVKITDYDPATMKFSIDSTISWLAVSSPGEVSYEIMGAYYEVEMGVSAAGDYIFITSGAIDRVGRRQSPYSSALGLTFTV